MQHRLNELTRARDRVSKATAAALEAARVGAAPACMRLMLKEVDLAVDTGRRVDLLYLIHSILQAASKAGLMVYRSAAGAGLKQLVPALCRDAEGTQKAVKVRFTCLIMLPSQSDSAPQLLVSCCKSLCCRMAEA